MIEQQQGLIKSVRERFMHVEECPFEGKRIFFENAGGSLRLKSVVETSALFASIQTIKEEKMMPQER